MDLIERQKAIDALARMMPRSYTPDGSHPADEEIFRAQEVFADCIEALEILPSAQPATNCSEFPNNSDTISRQQAIDALASMYCKSDEDGYVWIIRRDAWARIDSLPPAKPKRGKWIRDGHHIRCDQCGMYMCDTDREGDRIPAEFCPHCGADMREVTT